jgi:hypothetical protein
MALLQKAYLGATPLFRDEDWFENNSTQIVDYGVNQTMTADTAAHTKGAWQQLIASTSADASFLFFSVIATSTNATNTATLLDIATGASGSEQIIAENIAIGSANGVSVVFPFKVPSGTRLAGRIQSVVTGGKTAGIRPIIIDAEDYATAPTSVDVIGGNTANSQGISFSGAAGTWNEAVASTSRAYRAVAIVLSAHDADMANIVNVQYLIGVGSAGNEVAFGGAAHNFAANEQSTTPVPYITLFGRSIPAGSRLAVQHPITANPERYGFTLIGIP